MSKAATNKRTSAERAPRKQATAKSAQHTRATSPKAPVESAQKAANAELKAALQAKSGIERRPPKGEEDEQPAAIGKGRKGRKAVVVYLHPAAKDLIESISHTHKRTVQDLGIEAMNLLFRSYGEKPIA